MKIAKGLFVVAAFVLASSAAQAQYTFEYGGRAPRTARSPARAASAACSGCDGSPGGTGAQARRRSGGKFAARGVADRREGRQGQDRAMRRQSLRLFGGFEVGQERRAGSDQSEARQGRQMERADSRPQYRLNL